MSRRSDWIQLFIFSLVGTLCIAISFPRLCGAQVYKNQALQNLLENPKIISPKSTLQKFIDGKATVSIIVRLQEPATAVGPRGNSSWENSRNAGAAGALFTAQEIAIPSNRERLRNRVKALQDQFLEKLDSRKARVTNRFSYLFGFAAEVTIEGMQELAQNDQVLSIEENQVIHAHLAQGIPLINASAARSRYDGSGLSIAICDTGIDTSHPMLGGSDFPNFKVIGGYDVGDSDTDPRPNGNGHGTACAGIAAGDLGVVDDYIGGVAPGAKLYSVKISYGTTGSATIASMIDGWEWCITHQFDNPNYPIMIISTSFGGGRALDTCDSLKPSMTEAAAHAMDAGITIFCSAGNDGYCDSIEWPACISHVISVGAVYDAAQGTRAWCVSEYSCAAKVENAGCSTGWCASDSTATDMVPSYSDTASFLSILAPSNNTDTTWLSGTYDMDFGGTSAACPYAAGAAAVLQSAAQQLLHRFLTPLEIKDTLINTGDPVADGKVALVKPRVNLGRAVNSLAPATNNSLPAVYLLFFD